MFHVLNFKNIHSLTSYLISRNWSCRQFICICTKGCVYKTLHFVSVFNSKRLETASGEGNGNPLQYSCLENPMDEGAWWAAVHGVAKSRTRLSDFTLTSLSCIGEGNGNPLQCSCLENPRDGGASWADVSGVTQCRTRLKWLSSSSRLSLVLL